MKEAKIKCMCNQYYINDLNLNMTKGQVVYLFERKARDSKDLAKAIQLKAVDLQWVKRCEEFRMEESSRKPQPPWLQKRKPHQNPAPKEVQVGITKDEVSEVLSKFLKENYEDKMKSLSSLGQMMFIELRTMNSNLSEIKELLRDRPSIQGSFQNNSQSNSSYSSFEQKPENVFIPKNLVPDKTGVVSVEVHEGGGDDMDEALRLLKSRKGK